MRKRIEKESAVSIACDYAKAGLSVIPIRADGSKAPSVKTWTPFQSRRPNQREIAAWFSNGSVGIGIVGGRVSGGLEVLDFDDPACVEPWKQTVNRLAPTLLERLPHVQTPSGGLHIFYRCKTIEGNQKLAQCNEADPVHKEKPTLIETRGEGGYVVAPGSPPECHLTGHPYEHIAGPPLTGIPKISPQKRDVLLTTARMLNRKVEVITGAEKYGLPTGDGRPGDEFNLTSSWAEVLTPHGWKAVSTNGDTTYWRRPGKRVGISATSGFCTIGTSDLLYIFSTNANPFEAGRAYNKFAAYALLDHGGDFRKAAQQLAAGGYGTKVLDTRGTTDAKTPSLFIEVEPSTEEADGITLLADLEAYLSSYVIFPPGTVTIIALWVLAAWAVTIWCRFPHLILWSPQRRCAKTRTLELLRYLCPRAVFGPSVSAAALYRLVAAYSPTMLIDEAQWLNDPHSETARAYRELLCGGIERKAVVIRCSGPDNEATAYSVYGPKCLALIGRPEAVTADRSICVVMQRKALAENIEPWRSRMVEDRGLALARRAARWVKDATSQLEGFYDTDQFFGLGNERLDELLAPMRAVAQATDPSRLQALETWAKAADAVDLEDEPFEIRLLAALRDAFGDAEFLATMKILPLLENAEIKIGRRHLGTYLRGYGVHSRKNKAGTCRGYLRSDFEKVWKRYLPVVVPVEASKTSEASDKSS